jgi:hypothetical protein
MSDSGYTDVEMDLIIATNDAKQWRDRFESLKEKYDTLLSDYEQLQNIYVETEDEMTGYRDSFLNESIRHDNEMTEVRARIATLEAFMRSSNA